MGFLLPEGKQSDESDEGHASDKGSDLEFCQERIHATTVADRNGTLNLRHLVTFVTYVTFSE
jgi:hypothetical protein